MALSLIGQQALAQRLEGAIQKQNSAVYLRDSNNTKYLLDFTTVGMELIASRLKTKDFVSLDGLLDSKTKTIQVRSINFVGLQQVLGKWSDAEGFCYFFENFQTLKIYRMTATRECVFNEAFLNRTMSYTINPSNENWLMLISDSNDSYILDLLIKNRSNMSLVLYDPDTADILRTIGLAKLQ